MLYIFLIILIIILGSFAYASFRSIGWVPMWKADIEEVIKLAELKPGEKFCDLGCGEGKMLRAASSKGAQAIGYEISILPYLIGQVRNLFSKNKIKIIFKDFWLVDLSEMDVVFFFLIPKIYPKMKEKLQKELKPGTRIITYVWPFQDWPEEKIFKRDKGPAIYMYRIK